MTCVSSGAHETNEKKKYGHGHMDISIQNTNTNTKKKNKKEILPHIYVPETAKPLFKKLITILRREGKSFSQWVREQAANYVRIHSPGNPIIPLTKFVDGKPLGPSIPTCGYAGQLHAGKIYCNKDTLWKAFPSTCLACWPGKWENQKRT